MSHPAEIETYSREWLTNIGFVQDNSVKKGHRTGVSFQLPEENGNGRLWVYGKRSLFDIKRHDFLFEKDEYLEFYMPECLSITYYESISGVELDSNKVLKPGCVMAYIGGEKPYRIKVRGGVPIRSIGVEIWPDYYQRYLRALYPEDDFSCLQLFEYIGTTYRFPQMVELLKQINDYSGDEMSAKLFYEGKVVEVLALITSYVHVEQQEGQPELRDADVELVEETIAYIHENLHTKLAIHQLAEISCMGETKFKRIFKSYTGMTAVRYMQTKKMEKVACLLKETDLSIGEISHSIGYSNPGRMSELFKRSYGMTPKQYRNQ